MGSKGDRVTDRVKIWVAKISLAYQNKGRGRGLGGYRFRMRVGGRGYRAESGLS